MCIRSKCIENPINNINEQFLEIELILFNVNFLKASNEKLARKIVLRENEITTYNTVISCNKQQKFIKIILVRKLRIKRTDHFSEIVFA